MSDIENAVPASNVFETELGRQILASERERAGLEVLTGLAIFVTLAVVSLSQIARGQPWSAFKWALIITIAATVYEWTMRQLFGRYLRKDRQLPWFIRYVNAAIETSVPTLVLIAFVYTMNVDTAMTSGAILTYFFFIILSALSLDFRLSVFAGVVAALGYVALVLIYRNELPLGPGEPPERTLGYVIRPVFLLFGGIIAAWSRRVFAQVFCGHFTPPRNAGALCRCSANRFRPRSWTNSSRNRKGFTRSCAMSAFLFSIFAGSLRLPKQLRRT